MKLHIKYLLLVLSLLRFVEEPPSSEISVIEFSSYGFSYETGHIFEIRNNIKIAYYKDYTLYRTTIITQEDVKTSSPIFEIDLNDTSGTKSYRYYVLKNGDQKGLVFSPSNKMKTFNYDSFLKNEGLNFKDYGMFSLDLGKPDKVERNKKTNELEIEKFANKIKGETEPDSLYRYYNKDLIPFNFSFHPPFDQKAQSKLWKIGLIYNPKPDHFIKKRNLTRKEIYWQFKKSAVDDSTILLKYFERFIVERKKMMIK